MTICSILDNKDRAKFCLSTCCYAIERTIFGYEIEIVGEENVMIRYGRPYLKAKPKTGGACLLLDEKTLECTLKDNRPYSCKNHDCKNMAEFQDKYQNVKHSRKRRGLTS